MNGKKSLSRAIAAALGTGTVISLQLAVSPVMAQQSEALEEIVVTARKRGEELLQNTPLSIRALTSETLTDAGIEQFEDWVRLVPGITFKDLGPGEKTIVTRGLVSTGAATTAVYFDETNISAFNDGEGGGRNVDLKLFDVERIDVLRGPQGTTYGASALGGVIRIETAKPNLQNFSGSLEGDVSYTDAGSENYQFHGHVNIPIIEDKLGLRIVGWSVDNSGYIDNIRLGRNDINDEETRGMRAIARYLATDQLTITASATIQNQDIGDGVRYNRVGDSALVFPGETPFAINGDLQNSDFTVNNRSDDPRLYSLTAEYDFVHGNIVATTNFYDRALEFNFDSTPILLFFGVPIKALSSFPEDREIFSNEIRFSSDYDGPLQVLAGVFYQEEEIQSASNVFTVGDDGQINEASPSVLSVVRDRQFDETAIFGELSYDVTEQWNVTVGARYAEFDFVTDEEALVPFFGPPSGPEPTKRGDDSTEIFRFNTSYQLTDDHMVYFTASEGFRRGGLNLNAFGTLFDIPETFESDSLWNYEIGAKTSWLERRLTLNATLYRLDWSDIQLETVDELGGIEFFANAGEAQVNGLELELFARPIEGLDIIGTLGWTDAELTEDPPPPSNGLDGDEINNVPEWTGSLSVQYAWPAFQNFDGFVRADLEYTDGSNTRIAGRRDPFNVALESYDLMNLRAGIENDRWRVTFYANNVFDEITQNDAINEVTNILAYFTTRPRTVGVKVGYQF